MDTAESETEPKRPEAITAACAGPPRVRRIIKKAMVMGDFAAPVADSKEPKMINGRTLFSRIPSLDRSTALELLNQRLSAMER